MKMIVSEREKTHFENHFEIEKIEFRPKRIHPFVFIRCASFSLLPSFFNAMIDFYWSTICSNTYCVRNDGKRQKRDERNQRIEAEKIWNRAIIFHGTHSFASLQLPASFSLQFYADYFHIPAAWALKCRDTHTHTLFLENNTISEIKT